MRMKLIGLAGAVLLLAGCSASFETTAEKCGGTTAGITMDGDVLAYDQDDDATGDGWTCLINELVSSKDDRYAITQALTPGQSGEHRADGRDIVYGMSDTGSVRLFFNP